MTATLRIWDTLPAARRLQARRAFGDVLARVDPLLQTLAPDQSLAAAMAALSAHDLTDREREVAHQRLLQRALDYDPVSGPQGP